MDARIFWFIFRKGEMMTRCLRAFSMTADIVRFSDSVERISTMCAHNPAVI